MKKCLLILAGVFCILQANAWKVTVSGTTVTIDGEENGLPQNWSDFGDNCSSILNAETLVFKGNIGSNNLSAFNQGKGQKRDNGEEGFAATTVDFSDAYFVETENGAGPYTFYVYAPNSTETPKYSFGETATLATDTDGNVQYTYDKSYHEDEEGKYIKRENVYYKTNAMSFQYFTNVTNPILSKNVESMCQNCINNLSNLTTTFTIPENIKFIASGAVDNTPISSITIPASVEFIQSEAIRNALTNALRDVTVMSATTVCENLGFLKAITVGQTNAQYKNYAVLHFPEDAAEYFVNENHPLDVATSLNLGWFQAWLDNHHSAAANGWQEFINSAPGDGEPIPEGQTVILRTYSDVVAHYVPLNYRAYLVNGVEGSKEKGYTLKLQETFAIPANTGVIIYGETESGTFLLPLLTGEEWQNKPYTRETTEPVTVNTKTISLQNYLVANCTLKAGEKIGPYELGEDKKVSERNFAMGRYHSTDLYKEHGGDDYIAFFRTKTMVPGSGKAHLKLPDALYSEPKGMEILAKNPSDFRETEWPRSYSEYGDWGTKPTSLPIFMSKSFGEPFEDAVTGISKVTEDNVDEAVYTLQGVKVANPTKGVYIKGGKKIVIK